MFVCLTLSLAQDEKRESCLKNCALVRCAMPKCEEGDVLDYEQCVPDTYSCCPRCVKGNGSNLFTNVDSKCHIPLLFKVALKT